MLLRSYDPAVPRTQPIRHGGNVLIDEQYFFEDEADARWFAQWTFLSDPARTVQKDLDIQEYTDPEHNSMIPHTLVLKPAPCDLTDPVSRKEER